MKVSLNWLKELVELPASVPALVDLLTLAGVEVEGIASTGVSIPKIVVAQILESERHPNADRLSVCKVDDGSGTPRQIVCGAKNYKVGDKVPLALPGAEMPAGFKIKVGKLRGVESEGMMCSAEELGLPKGEDGLLILPPDTAVGTSFSDLYPGDTVLDLEITPNRPDLLSHIGIAREIAALTGKSLTLPAVVPSAFSPAGAVTLETPMAPLYTVLAVSGVKVGPSPDWLRKKLEAVGLRSINNVVDITNFVMLETGQPLHAFDAAKVNGDICVRVASEGESFLALDGRTYKLNAENVVIADSHRPLALAGVMGGEDSGVTVQTADILLESAYFAPGNIRRTSRTLGLSSESSYRFERGVNIAGVHAASQRAAALIVEIAGGTVGAFKEGSSGPLPQPGFVTLRPARVTALLGTEIPEDRVDAILSRFGLTKTDAGWSIPAYRQDLLREVDLIEEIARVIGIEKIPARLTAIPAAPGAADAAYDFNMAVRQKLSAQGLSEARTSTLISEAMLWQEIPAIRLRNPLGEDQSFLRTSLLPGLLSAIERNIRQGAKRIGLFEIGRTFHAEGPEERATLAFVLTGETATDWRGGKARPLDWHDAKGLVRQLLPSGFELQKTEIKGPLALGASILSGEKYVGQLGQLAPSAARDLGANGAVLVAEIDLAALQAISVPRAYADIPKFPAVTRDMAIVCPLTMTYGEIENTLRAVNEPLLATIEPFDIFTDPTGEKLSADCKSLAISLTFRDIGRTLNSEEVNVACERLKQSLKAKLAVDFRE